MKKIFFAAIISLITVLCVSATVASIPADNFSSSVTAIIAIPKVFICQGVSIRPIRTSDGVDLDEDFAGFGMVMNPEFIIADEPTGNVDPNMSYEIVSMLTEINKQGTTILMVTHDHNLVRDFQHRVIMLDGGKIVADNAGGNIQ